MSLTAMVMGPFVYPMIKCVMDTTIVSTERMKRPLCVNVSFTFKMNCLSLKESLLYDTFIWNRKSCKFCEYFRIFNGKFCRLVSRFLKNDFY